MINDLIGKSFRSVGGCYGLMRECFRRNGIDLPEENIAVTACKKVQQRIEERKKDWTPIKRQQDGCAIMFKPTRSDLGPHLGYYLGKGRFIHVGINFPVTVDRLDRHMHKVEGFYVYNA